MIDFMNKVLGAVLGTQFWQLLIGRAIWLVRDPFGVAQGEILRFA